MPQQASYADVEKLQTLKNEFPFFQSAHLLLSLVSKRHDSSLFQQTLKDTAISIPNRSRLYFLLNSPDLFAKTEVTDLKKEEVKVETQKQIESKISEIEHLKVIEVESEKHANLTEEELNAQVEKEVEKQIITAFVEQQILKKADNSVETKKESLNAGSFTDWLKNLKKEDYSPEKTTETNIPEKIITPIQPDIKRKLEQKAIIDRVIESNPSNIRIKEGQKFFASDNKAKESLFENEELVTETLAKIYAMQGNISKAIRAYEILSLKFPQKSAYFASLIENLKKENQ